MKSQAKRAGGNAIFKGSQYSIQWEQNHSKEGEGVGGEVILWAVPKPFSLIPIQVT